MEKKKVSRFEYAIAQAANVSNIDQLQPITEAEEAQQREDNLREQASKFMVLNPPAGGNGERR